MKTEKIRGWNPNAGHLYIKNSNKNLSHKEPKFKRGTNYE